MSIEIQCTIEKLIVITIKLDYRRYSTISRPRVQVEVENLLDFEENLFFVIF